MQQQITQASLVQREVARRSCDGGIVYDKLLICNLSKMKVKQSLSRCRDSSLCTREPFVGGQSPTRCAGCPRVRESTPAQRGDLR